MTVLWHIFRSNPPSPGALRHCNVGRQLAIHLGLLRETLAPGEAARRVQDILQVPGRVEEALALAARVEEVALKYKHATNALFLGRGTGYPLALKGRRYDKILSNIQEVKARGGRVIAIASHDDTELAKIVDDVLPIHDDRGIMNSIVCAVPLQLFAYHIAVARGCDVDKPRNLAKSVTVE